MRCETCINRARERVSLYNGISTVFRAFPVGFGDRGRGELPRPPQSATPEIAIGADSRT